MLGNDLPFVSVSVIMSQVQTIFFASGRTDFGDAAQQIANMCQLVCLKWQNVVR